MKTATQLEREYRSRMRKAGIKLTIIRLKLDPEVDRDCELRGISRSEYLVGLIRKYRAILEPPKRCTRKTVAA